MARAKQPKQIIQMTVAQFEAMFPNEDARDAYLSAIAVPELELLELFLPRER